MNNRVNFPTVIRKTVTVNSFSHGISKGVNKRLAGIDNLITSYNFDYSDGSLKPGVSIAPWGAFNARALSGVIMNAIYFYPYYNHQVGAREDRVVIYASDGYLYVSKLNGTFVKLGAIHFKTKPQAIPYNYLDNDVMLFSSPENGLAILHAEELTLVENAPPITSLCIHNERLFVTVSGEGNSLWFSDDFNPTNWAISLDEAGFIEFADNKGKLLRVVSFLGSVYAFREYGITRVNAFANQNEFTADNLFGSQGKIIGSSITDCGDYIVMLTSTGFYKFNGLDAVKILGEYDQNVLGAQNDNAKGVLHGTTLYFRLNMNIEGKTENVVLVYNTIEKTSYLIRGITVKDFCFAWQDVNEVLVITSGSYEIYYFTTSIDNNLDKTWKSSLSDFGIKGKNKRLASVSLYTENYVKLIVYADSQKCVYELDGKGVFEVRPGLKGEYFGIEISTHLPFVEVLVLTVTVEYVKGESYAT